LRGVLCPRKRSGSLTREGRAWEGQEANRLLYSCIERPCWWGGGGSWVDEAEVEVNNYVFILIFIFFSQFLKYILLIK